MSAIQNHVNSLNISIDELKSLLAAAYTDTSYGCLTRAGFDATHQYAEGRDVVFFDVDHMHDLNAQYGYEGVNARIKASLVTRESDETAVVRWFSGDEFIVIVPSEDSLGLAHRIRESFKAQGISATFGIAPLMPALQSSVDAASAVVQAAKLVGLRGTVTVIGR